MWILIIMLTSHDGSEVHSIEFMNERRCESALEVLKPQPIKWRGAVAMICVEK